MKVIRYSDRQGGIRYGVERDGEYFVIEGDLFS